LESKKRVRENFCVYMVALYSTFVAERCWWRCRAGGNMLYYFQYPEADRKNSWLEAAQHARKDTPVSRKGQVRMH